jgi:hypothetical protein
LFTTVAQSFDNVINTVGRKAFGQVYHRDLLFAKAKSPFTFFAVKVYVLAFDGAIAAFLADGIL